MAQSAPRVIAPERSPASPLAHRTCSLCSAEEPMTSHIEAPTMARARPIDRAWMRALVPLGRVLFAAIFIMSSFGHITGKATAYAAQAGVPMASVLVPLSGIIALAGGAMIALGFHARIGALLLIIFLVPVTLWMHDFW